jgi:hypothetical protein
MRRRPALRALALALPALLALGCPDVTAPLPSDGAADAFRVRFSGYGFGAHEVTLTGDTLRVVRRQFAEPRTGVDSVALVPDAAAWRAFWVAARPARIERWPSRCIDERIADGFGFDLRIVADGRTWEASASNAYPTGDGRCTDLEERSSEYVAFLRAVSVLIGRPFP